MNRLLVVCVLGLLVALNARAQERVADPTLGSVIFIHPDGASSATWTAARALLVGPDGDLNWDRLPHVAVYRGHMQDNLTATSNGGATTHATGVKVPRASYGMMGGGAGARPIRDAQGRPLSVAKQAIRAGLPVGLVQSGIHAEPGTGAFLAEVASRREYGEICKQLVESGAHVLMGGGEPDFLPEGVMGEHGQAGRRDDGLNLIEEAKRRGFTVIFTREELLNLPDDTEKVLGIFAAGATFNDRSEEELKAAGDLPLFVPGTPTIGEMTEVALRVLGRAGERFLLVVEEEGSDNFGNKNNAEGVLKSLEHADAAYGVALRYLESHPRTLILTCADSDGGGGRMVGLPVDAEGNPPRNVPARDFNGAPVDGVGGTGGTPFMSAPDRAGRSWPFAISWVARDDVSGGVVARAAGMNAHLVAGTFDNTDVATLIRLTLFGRAVPE